MVRPVDDGVVAPQSHVSYSSGTVESDFSISSCGSA